MYKAGPLGLVFFYGGLMEIKEAQSIVDRYIKSFEEGYFPPYTNLVRLMEEVGEFSKEFNHQFGPLKKKSKIR